MTRNQIEYLKLQELKRSNAANEGYRSQELAQTYELEGSKVGETQRHNRAVEEQALRELVISQQNADARTSDAETNRLNAYTNQRNASTNAFNAQTNYRNALTNERNAASNERQASASMLNAAIGRDKQVEEARMHAVETVQKNEELKIKQQEADAKTLTAQATQERLEYESLTADANMLKTVSGMGVDLIRLMNAAKPQIIMGG